MAAPPAVQLSAPLTTLVEALQVVASDSTSGAINDALWSGIKDNTGAIIAGLAGLAKYSDGSLVTPAQTLTAAQQQVVNGILLTLAALLQTLGIAASTSVGTAASPVTVSYAKPGGGSGTLTVQYGIITAIT